MTNSKLLRDAAIALGLFVGAVGTATPASALIITVSGQQTTVLDGVQGIGGTPNPGSFTHQFNIDPLPLGGGVGNNLTDQTAVVQTGYNALYDPNIPISGLAKFD